MGIDKADVRHVVHFDLSDAIESYVQEAGRAGRDGKSAQATILYNNSDLKDKEKMLADVFPELKFIKKVYKLLSVYLNVASGSHIEERFAYNHKAFCKKYDLPTFKTFNALLLLSKSDYIFLSDATIHPSRLQLDEAKILQLLEGKIDKRLHALMRVLLRNYEGLFLSATRIDEAVIAKKMEMNVSQIHKALQWLHDHAFAKYQPNFDGHFVSFPDYRFREDQIELNPTIYEHQIRRYKENLKILSAYIDSADCRQAFINRYFGFELKQACGVCDNCKNNNKVDSKKDIKNRLLELLRQEDRMLADLIHQFDLYQHNDVKSILNDLYDEELLEINEDRISLTKK
jgi:ATP-dependent DNA helicase RecQ